MQQIYGRTPMPKCDFSKVAKQLCWNHASAGVFSCVFAEYFQNTSNNTWEVYFWFPRFGRQYLFLNATPRVYCVEIWFRERCINNDLMSLLWFLYAFSTLEKQTFANVFQHRFSWKFLNVQRKTPLLESLVNKVAGLQHRWWLLLTII